MTNRSMQTTVTLPLLKTYVNALSATLAAEAAAPIANDSNTSTNAELLWIVEDQAALGQLESKSLFETDANIKPSKQQQPSVEYSATTLPLLAKQNMLGRYQLACFWLPNLTAELLPAYIPLLMRYRDLYAAHVIIAVQQSINLRTYGFIPFDIVAAVVTDTAVVTDRQISSSDIVLWQFNLYDYKRLPNWLNSDYWANPENWDKRRW